MYLVRTVYSDCIEKKRAPEEVGGSDLLEGGRTDAGCVGCVLMRSAGELLSMSCPKVCPGSNGDFFFYTASWALR